MKKLPLSLLLCAILCFFLWPAQAQTITTVAGQGCGINGDGIAATAANLNFPRGMTIDASGNLYVCDYNHHRVRKITPAGIITTIAGTGNPQNYTFGFPGAATATSMRNPTAIVIDHRGNFIISDDETVSKVDASGYMTVIAGFGSAVPGDGGMATDAQIYPFCVAVDASDNIYFTTGDHRIRKVDTFGIISSIAGDGTAGFSGDGGPASAATINIPTAIAISSSGEIYFSDLGNARIRKIDASGVITTIAGTGTSGHTGDGGAATAANIGGAEAIYIDGSGTLIFPELYNHRIRTISASGVIGTLAGTGTAGFSGDGGAAFSATFNQPTGFTMDAAGNMYVTDYYNNRVRKINTSGVVTTVAGQATHAAYSGDGGAATTAELNVPKGVVYDNAGNLYIADANNNRIRKIGASGVITTFAGTGTAGFSGDGGSATAAKFNNPTGVAADTLGNIYVLDKNNNCIRRINSAGIISTIAGGGTSAADGVSATTAAITPSGICSDALGNLYFSDTTKVRKVSTAGMITTVAGSSTAGYSGDGGPATAATTNHPGALALDPMGNLFFTDADNRVVRKINTAGVITRTLGHPFPAGTGGYYGRCESCDYSAGFDLSVAPINAIAADRWGNLFFAEGWDVVTVRRMDTAGVVHLLAGTEYNAGYTGDGGPATNAQLWGVSGMALDGAGHLFVAEADNSTVREISLCTPTPTITLTTGGVGCTGITNFYAYSDASGPDNYWSSSDTSVASILPEGYLTVLYGGAYGRITGRTPGTALITISSREICGSRVSDTATVVLSPGIEGSILSPRSICLGGTIAFTDTFTGGTWRSYNTSIASVSSTGAVTGLDTGFATIEYSATIACGLSIDTQIIRVVPGSSVSAGTITGTSSICPGTSTTLSDTASGGAWSSSATSIASVSTTGVVYGVAPGTATIRYMVAGTCNTDTASFNITITATPSAGTISGPASVCNGSTIILTDPVTGGTWSSSNLAIASISAAGTVYGLAAGTATISYSITGSCGSATATYAVTVNPLPVAGTITGTTATCVAATTTLSSTATGGSWYSANASVASVSSTGVVTGIGSGSTTINYIVSNTCGADTAFATVTITGAPSAGSISGSASVCVGASTTLSEAVTGGTWSSSAVSVASVDATTGVVYGVASGTANISYSVTGTCGTAVATHTITVGSSTSAGTISGAGTICAAAALSLSASVTGGSWVSSNPSIASVNATGTVTGVSGGTVTIYYIVSGTCGADSARATVTVSSVPSAGTITGGTGICMGATTTLTSSATGGTWGTSDASIASITTGGVVYSVGAGTVTLSYTVTSTCGTSTATHSLTVNALPVLSATTASGCGASTTLVAAGALYYSWSPATGLSCSTCSTVLATPTTTTNYTLVGIDAYGCVNTTSISVNGNRIYGHVSFSGTAPDTLDTKVWLIQFTASDSSLTATDSTTTCLDGGVPYFEFMSQPTGNYMVKGKLIYGNVPGTSGYLPTYADSTINWYAARIASHTSSTDNLNITMLYGTVPSGPGFIGGSVVSGAGKGTAGEVAERGMIIYLKNATGDVVTYVYTDAAGNYSFSGLAYGTYYVYPADFSYYTTPSGAITLSSSTPSVTGIKFKKYTTSGIIIPLETTGFTTVNTTGTNVTVFPNPTNGELMINWNKAISGGATFTLTDVAGRVVYTNNWNLTQSTSYREQLPTLVTGMYQVTITSSDFYYNGKLMVQQ